MDISVIIVSYNSRSVLAPCLDSLKRQSCFSRIEVIVVDNASADGTPAFVHDRYPWVKLAAGPENVGFSRGVNLGIREASGRYFLILNPDTVLREESIEEMVRFMTETPDAGIVGPKLVFNDGNLQYSCRRFYNWRVLLLRRTILGRLFKESKAVAEHLMLDFDHDSTRQVDWLLGACMLVSREAVASVGLMDERFFLYFEDVDWCYRMQQKGWKVYYHPGAVVVHDYARDSAHSVINRSFLAHLVSLARYYEKWNVLLYLAKKYREVGKIIVFALADVVAFNLAFLCAYYLRVSLDDVFPNPLFPIAAYKRFVVFENLLFVFTYFALGLYRIRRGTTAVDELFSIARAIILSSILLMASTYISHIRYYSRLVVAFLVPLATLYDWGARAFLRKLHRGLLVQRIDLKRVCIVGAPDEAGVLERKLTADEGLGVEVVGVVVTGDATDGRDRSLGAISELGDIVDRYRIQELIFLPRAVPEERIAEFIALGRRRLVDVTVITDYSGLVIHQASVTQLAGRPVIAYHRDTRYAVDRLAKRLIDIVMGLFFLVVSGPFFVIYFLSSVIRGGTPVFMETRLGLHGKPFHMPVTGARSANGPSDIVNLPLFWLVVTGKMSMVGPCALSAADSSVLGEAASFRFDVLPGVTGYWRVGDDKGISVEDLLVQDASYTRNWSLIQDLKVLAMSIGNMLLGRKRSIKLKQPEGNK